jgi:hypothetical protein
VSVHLPGDIASAWKCVCVCAHACACVSVERLGPQGKSGHRAQASLKQGGCRAGCGERDQAHES